MLALAGFATPATAQTTVAEQGLRVPKVEIRPVDLVVTAIRASQPSIEVGQAVTVLDQADLDRRQLPVVSDLLAETPGVTVTRNGGPGQPTAVRIRGAEDAQTLVVIDGVRVNDPSAPAGAFDFGNLLTQNIERIEVLRGPASVPWGSQAIGGVVNVTTATTGGLRARGEYGYKNNVNVVGNAGGTFGPLQVGLGGGWFRDDGVSAAAAGTERDGYRQYAGNGRATLTLSDAVSLDLRGFYARSRVAFDGYAFVNGAFQLTDTPDYAKTEQIVGYAGVNARLGALENRLALTVNDINRDSFAGPNLPPDFRARGRVERLEYQGDVALGSLRAVFGAEHERSRFTDLVAPEQRTHVSSAYLQLIAKPVEPLSLTGGVRVDDHATYGTQVTGAASGVLRLGSHTLLRVAYAGGFKAPTLFQLYSIYGNTSLRPERADSVDLGLEQQFGSGGRVGVTLFGRDTRDQIDFSFAARPGRPFGFYDNVDRARARGFESFVELRPTPDLLFNANYTFLDARDRDTDLPLLRRPKHSVTAALDWTRGALQLGGTIRLVSASRDLDANSFLSTKVDGYALASVRAVFRLSDALELYGRIENLTNARYQVVSGYGTLPRNAHVGVRVRL